MQQARPLVSLRRDRISARRSQAKRWSLGVREEGAAAVVIQLLGTQAPFLLLWLGRVCLANVVDSCVWEAQAWAPLHLTSRVG